MGKRKLHGNWTEQQKISLVKQFLAGRMTHTSFARKHKMSESTLYKWLKMYPTTEETPVNEEPVKEVPVAPTTVPETNTMSFARLFAYGSPKTIMELYDLEVSEGVSHEEALEYIIRSVRWGCNVVGSKT